MAKKQKGIKKVLSRLFSKKAKVGIAPTNSGVLDNKQDNPALIKEEAEIKKLQEEVGKIREWNSKGTMSYVPPIPTDGNMEDYKKELQRIITKEGKEMREELELERLQKQAAKIREWNAKTKGEYISPIPTPQYFGSNMAEYKKELQRIITEEGKEMREELELERLQEQAAKIREQNVEKAYNGYIPPIPTPGSFGNNMEEYKKELERIIKEEGEQVQKRRIITIKDYNINRPFQEGRTLNSNRGERSKTRNNNGLTNG